MNHGRGHPHDSYRILTIEVRTRRDEHVHHNVVAIKRSEDKGRNPELVVVVVGVGVGVGPRYFDSKLLYNYGPMVILI